MKGRGTPQVSPFLLPAQICDHDVAESFMWDSDFPFSEWKLNVKEFLLVL